MKDSIGILGGTGKQGAALAKRLILKGYPVIIGSRNKERGETKAKQLNSDLDTDLTRGGTNFFACQAETAVISIPFDSVDAIVTPLKDVLEEKIVIDMTVNLEFGKTVRAHTRDGKSSFEYISDLLPKSHVVAAFKTISHLILGGEGHLDQTDFQVTDSDTAFNISSKISQNIGLTPVRITGNYHAHTLERMVALSIQINKRYSGSHSGYKLTNIHLP